MATWLKDLLFNYGGLGYLLLPPFRVAWIDTSSVDPLCRYSHMWRGIERLGRDEDLVPQSDRDDVPFAFFFLYSPGLLSPSRHNSCQSKVFFFLSLLGAQCYDEHRPAAH